MIATNKRTPPLAPSLLAGALGLALCGLASAAQNGQNACSRTSQNAYVACSFEALDDLFIARGNCENISDPDESRECDTEAQQESFSARQECGEQRDARRDLCDEIGEAPYDPVIDPAMFVNPDDIGGSVAPNPYFLLVPGRVMVYEAEDELITVEVLDETREIDGVACRSVRDIVFEDGELVEDTVDWYAQDIDGNVWYFGEIAQNFEDGFLADVEGSWLSGVDGAKAGILIHAAPMVGSTYRQEFLLGDAEDIGTVISTTASATTPAASCNGDCLQTQDGTPIEPGVFEFKYYKPGVGPILETNPDSGERLELVEVFD